MPGMMVDLNKNNKGAGWDVRINRGFGLFGEHHFSAVNSKLFIGGQLGLQEFKISSEKEAGSTKFSNVLAMGYFGYTINPFQNALYIKPWAGVGYTSKISGSSALATAKYDIAPLTMFATLHVGYTF
jgi:hypothetical protein